MNDERESPESGRYKLQHFLATQGDAVNQCSSCGVYRADGQLPLLHRMHCQLAPIDRGTFRTF